MHLTLCNMYKTVAWLLNRQENEEILRYIRKIHYTCADFNHESGNTKCETKKKYKVWNKKKKKNIRRLLNIPADKKDSNQSVNLCRVVDSFESINGFVGTAKVLARLHRCAV